MLETDGANHRPKNFPKRQNDEDHIDARCTLELNNLERMSHFSFLSFSHLFSKCMDLNLLSGTKALLSRTILFPNQ